MDTPAELREDAPEEVALAREQRLQRCREKLRGAAYDSARMRVRANPWTAEHMPELVWVQALAEAGHVGARRLLDYLLQDEDRFVSVMPTALEFFAGLARKHRQVALALVNQECAKPIVNAETLQRWLTLLPERGAALATTVAELAGLGALSAQNVKLIRRSAATSTGGERSGEDFIADLLWDCAQTGGEHAMRVAARSAELGSPDARFEYVLGGHPHFASEEGESWWTELCAAIREVRRIDPLTNGDRDYLRRQLHTVARHRHAGDKPGPGEPARARFVHGIAQSRLKAGQADIGNRLWLRAAELGCSDAILACLEHGAGKVLAWVEAGGAPGHAAAQQLRELVAVTGGIGPADFAPKLDQVREFFKGSRDLGRFRRALCIRTGAAIELGELGKPDIARATEWYSLALGSPSHKDTGKLSQIFCWELAVTFDRAESHCLRDEPKLAVAWYDRGLRVGGQLSLQRLLRACATGDLGLARNADAALERLNAFFSEPAHQLDYNHTDKTAAALLGAAIEDAANEEKWKQAARRLMTPEQRVAASRKNGDSEFDAKIELAKEYRRLGDHVRAQQLLNQVLLYGPEEAKAKVRALLS